MGMSSLADHLTGQSIARGEPVVAVVLVRRTGGYPDATSHAAKAPLSPTEMFEPVALPVKGSAGDYGGVEPAGGDLGTSTLLDLAGLGSWEEFSGKAFGIQAGIVLGKAARGLSQNLTDPHDATAHVLGLAVFRKATWEHLLSVSYLKDRRGDVDKVLSAMTRVHEAFKSGDRDAAFSNSGVLSLSQGLSYLDGKQEFLPDLARVLAHREGGSLLSDVSRSWLTRKDGPFGYGLLDVAPGEKVREMLDALWELRSAEIGLGTLGRSLGPSFNVGQHDNALEVFGTAVTTMESCGDRVVAACEDWSEDGSGPALLALLERVDRIRDDLTARLAFAGVGPNARRP